MYKIGKTIQQPNKRLGKYPKGSSICVLAQVIDSDTCETQLKEVFDRMFIKRLDLGIEYYEGKLSHILTTIYDHIHKERISQI